MMTGNKGEWSEIYALLKLLADSEIYLGDEKQDKILGISLPIVSVLRSEQEHTAEYSYRIGTVGKEVIVSILGTTRQYRLPLVTLKAKTEYLLEQIQSGKGRSFPIPDIETFLKGFECNSIKAPSRSKSDIHVVVHDAKTGMSPDLGFSIKSQLGGQSTLFNVSKSSTVTYKISNFDEAKQVIVNSIDGNSKIRRRILKIIELGSDIVFYGIKKPIFKNNLAIIDSMMPALWAEMVKSYFLGQASRISDLAALMCRNNPNHYDKQNGHHFYEYKIKRLLNDMALGMTSAKVWQGEYDATGGYLIVKNSGDIVCYHIYYRNSFDDYLFNYTAFDTPDPGPKKWNYGFVYKENGSYCIDLNAQIRFIH